MKRLRLKIEGYLLMLLMLVTMCGCQKAPTQATVAGETTDESRSNVAGSSSSSELLEPSQTQVQSYRETFSSLDGNVDICFEIDKINPISKTPIIKVSPHYLTDDEVKIVAHSLFGDTDYFEARMRSSNMYSKKEIQERIKRWTQFTNDAAVQKLYGEGNSRIVDKLKNSIEKYTTLYETAPDETTVIPAKWHFQKESAYYLSEEEFNTQDVSKDNDMIMIETKSNDAPYILQAARRNLPDFKLNNISVFLNTEGSPSQIDARIYQAMLCRTAKPDDEQIRLIKDHTTDMLAEMKLGEWEIDQCYVEEQYYGTTPEYVIHVTAVPVFEGTPALRHPQLRNLKSQEVYASNYYLTDVEFEFSADGKLVSFWLYSPVDVKEVISTDALVANPTTLISKAKEMLKLGDIYAYGLSSIPENATEEIGCKVTINQMNYGLSRIRVPDSDTDYYYVPSVVFSGSVSYFGKESGTIYYISDESVSFLTLNAVDCTVIENS